MFSNLKIFCRLSCIATLLTNLDALTSLQFNMEAVLGPEDSSYYTEFIFDDSLGQPPRIKITTSTFDFMDGLANLLTTGPTTPCNLGVFEAMIIGLQSLYTPQSTVYVAARGNPNDLLNEGDFFALLLETQPQLFIHYSSIAGVCKFDPDDHVTKRMSEYAVASNGYLIPTSSLQFTTAISLVIPALYKGSVLANPIKFGNVCAATVTRYISIDESVRALTIFIYANNPNLVITDANGNNLKIINEFTDPPIKGNLSLHIFQVIDLTSYGIYIFNAQDIGICSMQIRTTVGSALYTGYVPYVAARGNPNDLLNEGDFFALLLETQPQLFIHYSSIAGVCKFDPDDHVTKRMSEYAVASNGYLIPTSSLQFTTAISLVIPALYKGSVLANPIKFGNVCAATVTRYISIDESVRALTIFIYANNPNLVITDANGNNLKIINEFTDPPIKGNLSLHIFQVIDLTSYGIYIFNAQDIGICSMQIRTTVGSALYTGYVPYVLASPTVSSHLDNATAVPLSDINVIMGFINSI
uniref:Por_Secre_tail domain-containing protein n=1 Tax=Rhabditophanes sp. KR3021 TaxID=114890 RepID=A0AC35TJL5_9BILA